MSGGTMFRQMERKMPSAMYSKCIAALDPVERVVFKRYVHPAEDGRNDGRSRIGTKVLRKRFPFWFHGPVCGWTRRVVSEGHAVELCEIAMGGAKAYGDLRMAEDGSVLGAEVGGDGAAVLPSEAAGDVAAWSFVRRGECADTEESATMVGAMTKDAEADRGRLLTPIPRFGKTARGSGVDRYGSGGGAAGAHMPSKTGEWIAEARRKDGGAWERVDPEGVESWPNAVTAAEFLRKWIAGRDDAAELETRVSRLER